MKNFVQACALLFVFALPASAEVYKVVGADGKVQYTDKAPNDRQSTTRSVKIEAPPAGVPQPKPAVERGVRRPSSEKKAEASEADPLAGESAECRKAHEYKKAAKEGKLMVSTNENGVGVKVDENNAKLFDNDILVYCKKK